MEAEQDKKLEDDVVVYLRKRSEMEAPRYVAKLHAYDELNRKRSRAAAAKRRTARARDKKLHADGKKEEMDSNEKGGENKVIIPNAAPRTHCGLSGEISDAEEQTAKRRGCDNVKRKRSASLASSEPADGCGCRRRRRRKRSCSRRRKRRRRSRRRSRRRRRSCSRRRRRKSACRKRRRRRRCR